MGKSPRVVIAVQNEVRSPLFVVAAFWLVVSLLAAIFARGTPFWIVSVGAVAGASTTLFLFISPPRRGELIRLVLDLDRRTVFWAHRGYDPEELPFAAVRAVVLEFGPGRRMRLYAVDLGGRWVELGRGPRVHFEPFAREVATCMGVPLWSRERGTGALSELSDLGLVHEDEPRAR